MANRPPPKKPRTFDEAKHCGHKVRQGERKGDRCTLVKGWGTNHRGFGSCKKHGGNTPSHVKAARNEMARGAVVRYGLPRKIEPQEALLEEIWRTAGHVDWLAQKVQEHDEDTELVFGLTSATAVVTPDGTTLPFEHKEEAKPSVWLVLYYKERQHLVDVCRVAIAAGIAERQVRLAEHQGKLIAQVLTGALKDLGIKDDKRVAKVLRKHLALVSDMTD